VRWGNSVWIALHCIFVTDAKNHMKKLLLFVFTSFSIQCVRAQDPWLIKASAIDPSNYYGITVANGMIGVVSSPEPFKV